MQVIMLVQTMMQTTMLVQAMMQVMGDDGVCDKLNKMHIISLPQQAKWLGDKRINMHPEGLRIIHYKMTWVVVNIGMLIKYSLFM